ncbi:hypothetical protein [Nostoc sp. UIC 10630]|uniref:hypothetical protein n=1 Tax=Nostoc sp. UIC 10630 TaxID=2100146 RepID=UPI0013D3C445|nr:hypothetical protein [Nostoc sp. UIC 10630]MBE8997014.1 hypothetical protein [Nostoc sp. LEGE 12447]NEU81804.1 hypothetical protein [Nostoc sp. UIC 10630]
MRSPYFIFIISHEDAKAAFFVIILYKLPRMQMRPDAYFFASQARYRFSPLQLSVSTVRQLACQKAWKSLAVNV